MLDTAMAGALITKTRSSTMQKFQIGSMQRFPLMISSILQHAAVAHGDREIVSRLVDEPLWRYDYAGLAERAGRAANMIKRLGVGPVDFVSTLAWNTHRHYELFFAVPGIGAVLHTGNPRLSDEQRSEERRVGTACKPRGAR